MKDEIKEILDKLNENKDYDDYVDYKGSYFKPLLDYITDLQKGYDNAVKQSIVDHKYASKKEDEIIVLQERIDKAIPMLKELNIKIKEILKIGIDIKEISDIENILQGSDNND